jgi:hypothetical protein
MSFDEVQSIWNLQQTPDGPLDRDGLLLAVVERDRTFNRIVTITDVLIMATLLFSAAMFLRDPLLQGHDLVLIIPAIACVAAACFVWRWRHNRKRRAPQFDDSLIGLISKSTDAVEDRIALMRKFLWWFACPNAWGLFIALFIIDESKRHLLYGIFIPAFATCMGLTYWLIRREVRLNLLPQISRLEALRSQLAGTE